MSLSKYSKRRGQFEALEAKQLFAADLVGGAAADLADTAVVAEYDPGDNTDIDLVPENVRTNLGGIKTNQESVSHGCRGGFNFLENANLGGQEGEPITEESAPVASIAPDGCVDLIGGAAIDLPDTAIVAEISHGWENPSNGQTCLVNTGLGGQEGEPLMNTNLGDHLVVDGEGLYQRNELELASSLGGQEGEPVVAPVSDMVFENLGGQDALIVMLEPDHQAVAPF
jgi:hypothetical protein